MNEQLEKLKEAEENRLNDFEKMKEKCKQYEKFKSFKNILINKMLN